MRITLDHRTSEVSPAVLSEALDLVVSLHDAARARHLEIRAAAEASVRFRQEALAAIRASDLTGATMLTRREVEAEMDRQRSWERYRATIENLRLTLEELAGIAARPTRTRW